MEQHPVPQDITGFEFKLVGDMTLKQFGYLAGGAVLAVLVFFSNLPPFFKWPLVSIFAFSGVAFAFMPIEERPLDKWVANFIKSIYSPTLFTWKKKKASLDFLNVTLQKPVFEAEKRLKALTREERQTKKYLTSLSCRDLSYPGKKESEFLAKIDFSYGGKAKDVALSGPAGLSGGEILLPRKPVLPVRLPDEQAEEKREKEGELKARRPVVLKEAGGLEKKPKKDEDGLANKITKLEEHISQLKEVSSADPGALWQLKELGLELQKARAEKEKLKRELAGLKKQAVKKKGVSPIIEEEKKEIVKTKRVKYMAGAQAQKKGLPISPRGTNIIGGIVKDKNGQELGEVIIVIKDKDDNPLRALKTNKVGQFMVATALPDGIYTMELEKDGFDFDIIEIELTGKAVPAIEITAK